MKTGISAEVSRKMDLEGLVADARARTPRPMTMRERLYAGLSATALLGVLAVVHAAVPSDRPIDPVLLVASIGLYALAFRCMFEVGQNGAHPTMLAFIPMLFAAPPALVPLFVALGGILGNAPDYLLKRRHPDRWLHDLGHAWYAVGPAVVIALWAPGPPSVEYAGVYVLAFAVQCVVSGGDMIL